MCMYIYIYIYIYMCVCVYIYIYVGFTLIASPFWGVWGFVTGNRESEV